MGDPHQVHADAVEPVHHDEEQHRLPVGCCKGGHAVPHRNDKHQHHQHNDAERHHEPLAAFHRFVLVSQAAPGGFVDKSRRVKIQAVHAVVLHGGLDHQEKQQTVQNQLDYKQHFQGLLSQSVCIS